MKNTPAIEELSDARLAELARDPQADVAALEAKLAEAKAAHNKTFPPGKTSDQQRTSQAAIDRLEINLRWAKERLAISQEGRAREGTSRRATRGVAPL